MTAVQKQVDGGEARRQIGPPPPVVVFGAEVEIAEEYRCFRAGDHEDDEHQEQEAEHVVHLRGPYRVQYEEELDENTAEW